MLYCLRMEIMEIGHIEREFGSEQSLQVTVNQVGNENKNVS